MSLILQAITRHARTDARRIALRSHGIEVTYGELAQQVDWLAGLLRQRLPDRVAIAMANSVQWVLIDLTCMAAGIATIPLPHFFTPRQIEHALTAAGVSCMLVEEVDAAADSIAVAGKSIGIRQRDASPVPLPDATAKVTFTSGTTREPQGVCLTLAGMERVAQSLLATISAEFAKQHFAILPLSVLLENVAGLYATLLAGGSYRIESPNALGYDGLVPDFVKLVATLKQNRATSCILVPELLRGIIRVLAATGQRLPDMRFAAVGGAKVSRGLLIQAYALDLPVYQGYGLTEAASVVAVNTPIHDKTGSVGRLLPHVSAEISPDGEIVLHDPAIIGYIGEPQHRGPLPTGDTGFIDRDGFLHVTGRMKNILITAHGRNVAPEWPESELLAQAEIAQCLVYGDGEPTLSALLVPTSRNLGDEALERAVARANASLPDYARICSWRQVQPFTIENGLLTGNGRPRRTNILAAHQREFRHTLRQEDCTVNFYDRLVQETENERRQLYAVPQVVAGLHGEISLATYIAYLTEAYHHVKHTTPLLMATGSRIPADREWLRDAIAEYIEEELGHQEWILRDIANAGGKADAVRAGSPRMATELMVAYAYDYISRVSPIGFFGMVFVLEGTSTELATRGAESLMEELELPPECFSYLLSHGTLDLSHMDFFRGLMERIEDPVDQAHIIHMARRMYVLFADVFRSIPLGDDLQDAA